MTCCGQPMRQDGRMYICGKCGGWFQTAVPEPSTELVADIETVFLGWWPEDLAAIVRQPYQPGALTEYAYREGGRHIPAAEAE